MKLKRHVFVCTHERPPENPKGCCKHKDAEQLVSLFKKEIAKKGIVSEVRAQKAGCLDICEFGPSVVVYPEGVWYGHVTAADVTEIVESHLIGGNPIERLKIPGK
ncbi:MAG: (2Fe-2S) ferredoxin domain-containing protein [Bdellovibrio sp.]|nr:(2Fe-2S) ferredoxin domain-containing protein [Bdellovibrio sp.]